MPTTMPTVARFWSWTGPTSTCSGGAMEVTAVDLRRCQAGRAQQTGTLVGHDRLGHEYGGGARGVGAHVHHVVAQSDRRVALADRRLDGRVVRGRHVRDAELRGRASGVELGLDRLRGRPHRRQRVGRLATSDQPRQEHHREPDHAAGSAW